MVHNPGRIPPVIITPLTSVTSFYQVPSLFGCIIGKMGYEYINVTSCLVTGIVLTAATVIAVALRVGVAAEKAVKSRDTRFSKHLDDFFCLLALLPTIGVSTVMIYGKIQPNQNQAYLLANDLCRCSQGNHWRTQRPG